MIKFRFVQVRQNLKRKKTFRVGGPQSPFSISSSFILFFVLLHFYLKDKNQRATATRKVQMECRFNADDSQCCARPPHDSQRTVKPDTTRTRRGFHMTPGRSPNDTRVKKPGSKDHQKSQNDSLLQESAVCGKRSVPVLFWPGARYLSRARLLKSRRVEQTRTQPLTLHWHISSVNCLLFLLLF